jgi:hypothetical protein
MNMLSTNPFENLFIEYIYSPLMLSMPSMYSSNGLEDNDNNSNNTVIIREFRAGTRIHEHDFISVKTKKEQVSIIICSICGLVYCEKCGKLVNILTKTICSIIPIISKDHWSHAIMQKVVQKISFYRVVVLCFSRL